MELEFPVMLLLLPLPWFIYRYVPAFRTSDSAVKVPFFRRIIELSGERLTTGGQVLAPSWWQKLCLVFVWVMLVIAACKPVILGEPQTFTKAGRDLMVVVDLSGSMQTNDFKRPESDEPISRLQALKRVLVDFSAKREGDRLGLILFGDRAYLQAPFTAEHKTWLSLVQETQVGMAGQSTHIGDALGLAMKVIVEDSKGVFEDNDGLANQTDKVIILLTDGNDTDSQVPPIEAAALARDVDVRIHTIAIGDPETVGESAMNIEELNKISQLTGGESFQAMSYQELEAIYSTLNELEPSEYASFSYQPKVSAHHIPISIGLGLYLFAYIVNFMICTHIGNKIVGRTK